MPRQTPAWDHRRNTSEHRPPPGTARQALEAMAVWRDANPEHAAWIAAGAPPIRSDAEHRRWFGCSYDDSARRRRRARA